MSKPILVLGEHGQVATELAKVATREARNVVFAGRDTLDLISAPNPTVLIDRINPSAVINAAAYSAVDAAESDRQASFRLNSEVPGLFARACADRGLPFVHFSTDYVFDGGKGQPYVEDDIRAPLNLYGASKAGGEDGVVEGGDLWAILRTSWLFSASGNNFAKTMLRIAETRDELGVVDDQIGSPTFAEDCALGAYLCVDRLLKGDRSVIGLFHFSGDGYGSWADLAEEVLVGAKQRGLPSAKVRRITTAEYPTPSKRPPDTRLDVTKAREVLGWRARPWKAGVARTLDELVAQRSAQAAG
jgi:dTDP-4-dehydrorhamnose reductase